MNLSWIFPVLSFLETAFIALSKLDGKPGLTRDDFSAVINKVRQLSTTDLTGKEKADKVASWVTDNFGLRLSHQGWISQLLTFIAYLWAKRKKLV